MTEGSPMPEQYQVSVLLPSDLWWRLQKHLDYCHAEGGTEQANDVLLHVIGQFLTEAEEQREKEK